MTDTNSFPNDPDIERNVLASLFFIKPDLFQEVPVRSELFWSPNNRSVFETMASLNVDGSPVDPTTVRNGLEKRGVKVPSGFVMEIYAAHVTAANISQHCEILEDKHKRRQLIIAATKAIELAREMGVDVDDTIGSVQTKLSNAQEQVENECLTDRAISVLEEQILARETGKSVSGMMTGVPSWDHSLKGIFPGDMLLIGARPKVGKTAVIETAMQTQIELGIPVLCFQRDTSLPVMLGRMACRKARVVYEDFICGACAKMQLLRMRKALVDLKKCAHLLRLYNPTRLTSADLHSIVIREIRKSGIKTWYLDHFQTLQYNGNIAEGMTQASMGLRRTINDTGIPGVIIAQISKEADKTPRPHSGQFKWCDQLFSDADKIVLMWSRDDPKELQPNERQMIQWTVDNSRTGAPSDNQMKFHREYLTFESEFMPG